MLKNLLLFIREVVLRGKNLTEKNGKTNTLSDFLFTLSVQ